MSLPFGSLHPESTTRTLQVAILRARFCWLTYSNDQAARMTDVTRYDLGDGLEDLAHDG